MFIKIVFSASARSQIALEPGRGCLSSAESFKVGPSAANMRFRSRSL